MPDNANYVQFYAVSILCGIGFAMSLFIDGLAFELSDFRAPVCLGVLSGSIVCAALGYLESRQISALWALDERQTDSLCENQPRRFLRARRSSMLSPSTSAENAIAA